MLNAKSLRTALKEIFGVDDKYLVPLDEGWYVPTYDKEDTVGTWIGYRVLSKSPNLRAYQERDRWIRSLKASFRISFVGLQAEELADMTLLWDNRTDVQTAFEKYCNAQLDYNRRAQFSYPIKNGGLNDNLCWCVDFACHAFYVIEANYELWHLKEVNLGGKIIIPKQEEHDGVQ